MPLEDGPCQAASHTATNGRARAAGVKYGVDLPRDTPCLVLLALQVSTGSHFVVEEAALARNEGTDEIIQTWPCSNEVLSALAVAPPATR